jgi:hypothetical protein
MDIEHISRQSYRLSVVVAIVLSAIVVTFAAVVGRGTLNLKGALMLDEPTDVTVIALVEPRLATGAKITGINFLRKEDEVNGRATFAYHVTISNEDNLFVKIYFDVLVNEWRIAHLENLHGGPSTETPPQQ